VRNSGDKKVLINFSNKKIGDQISAMNKRGIKEVIVIGDEESKTGSYKIKDLATGKETEYTVQKK
jgi:histidyl-tRNA synthetase